MTKKRPPLTPYRALSKIADLLGWDGCAAVLGKSESIVRKWADPDAEREISFQDALRLDTAYRRAGGDCAPLFECYAARLDLLTDEEGGDFAQLLAASSRAAKETAEAIAAAIDVVATNGDRGKRVRAVIECEEGIEAQQSLLFSLKRLAQAGG